MTPTDAKLWAAIEARKLTGKARGLLRSVIALDRTVQQAAKSRKQRGFKSARGGGQSSKKKGYTHMCQVRDLLLRAYPQLAPDDILVKAGSQGGTDLHLSPQAQKIFPFAVEGKAAEGLNIWAALTQARWNAQRSGLIPIVFFKRAGAPVYVALSATEFLHVLGGRAQVDPEVRPAGD